MICWASLHVGWAERFLRSPTVVVVGLRKKRLAQPTPTNNELTQSSSKG